MTLLVQTERFLPEIGFAEVVSEYFLANWWKHGLHREKILVRSNEDFVCSTLLYLQHFLLSVKPVFALRHLRAAAIFASCMALTQNPLS